MGNSSILAKIQSDAQDIINQVESMTVSTPTNFGPALCQSATPATTIFGPVGPYKVVFKNIADGTLLTLNLQSLPTGLVIGDPFTFSYVQDSPAAGIDTLSNLQAVTQTYSGFLIPFTPNADGSAALTFLSPTGLPPVTLKVKSVPAALASGVVYSIVYVPANATASGTFDELKSFSAVAPTGS